MATVWFQTHGDLAKLDTTEREAEWSGHWYTFVSDLSPRDAEEVAKALVDEGFVARARVD